MLVYTPYVHCIVINVNAVTRVIIRIASANYFIGHTTQGTFMCYVMQLWVGVYGSEQIIVTFLIFMTLCMYSRET